MATLLIDTLFRYRGQSKLQLHEFVVMPDHIHLLLTPAYDVPLEKAVQLIKGGFSYRVKKEMQSNLEIWQAGFTDHRVHDHDDYVRHAAYIRNNPLRASLIDDVAKYPYSSAAPGMLLDPQPPWLKPREEEVALSPA